MRRFSPRALIASLAALASGIGFYTAIKVNDASVFIPPVAIAMGAISIHFRPMGAQLLGRALFWSNFVLGVLLCILGSGRERNAGVGLVLGCGLALILAERRALAEAAEQREFRPAAYAGTLELVMVLALADAQTCLLFAALDKYEGLDKWVFSLATVGFVTGFIGLYRLRLWGIIATMTTALLVALALLTKVANMHDATVPLTVMFTAQILAPLPMLFSIVTKRPLPSPRPAVRSLLANGFVVVLGGGSVLFALLR